ncbi:MAG TPA: site-2 protease family protein [Gammaproteobacteria bacterium]
MDNLSLFQTIVVWAIPVLFAITVHEVSHGFVASRLGDPTARMLGRLTLNPIKHVDPLGTVVLPLLMMLMTRGAFVFGWAKPVPVTPQNLRNPKRDMALVAAAGPISNLLMALLWAILMRVAIASSPEPGSGVMFLFYMSDAGIQINIFLAVLNMIPLPPLDGGRVAVGLLPGPLSWQLSRIEPYGFFILIALLYSHVLDFILHPVISSLFGLYIAIGGMG